MLVLQPCGEQLKLEIAGNIEGDKPKNLTQPATGLRRL
jgi:hypothetical protein